MPTLTHSEMVIQMLILSPLQKAPEEYIFQEQENLHTYWRFRLLSVYEIGTMGLVVSTLYCQSLISWIVHMINSPVSSQVMTTTPVRL